MGGKIKNKSRSQLKKEKHDYNQNGFFRQIEMSRNYHDAHADVLEEFFQKGVIEEDSQDYTEVKNLEDEKDAVVYRDGKKYTINMRTLTYNPDFEVSFSLRTKGSRGGTTEWTEWDSGDDVDDFMSLVILDESGDSVGMSMLISLTPVWYGMRTGDIDYKGPYKTGSRGAAIYVNICDVIEYVNINDVSDFAADWL